MTANPSKLAITCLAHWALFARHSLANRISFASDLYSGCGLRRILGRLGFSKLSERKEQPSFRHYGLGRSAKAHRLVASTRQEISRRLPPRYERSSHPLFLVCQN